MKKIKIITFQNAHNYGAMLQAYSLQKILKEKFETQIINYNNPIIGNPYNVFYFSHNSIKSFMKSVVKSFIFYLKNKTRFNNFLKFKNTELQLTNVYESEEELKNHSPEADIYITGSDQVWNTSITEGLKDSYTLNFGAKNIKRISYAASIGNSDILDDEKEDHIEKISKIDYISVREETGKEALEKIINKPIETVLDPTLLLKREEWEEKIKDLKKEKEKYILAYVVEPDEEYIKIVNKLSRETGLKVIHFSLRKRGLKNILRNAYTEGPLEFVNLIKNSEYVVCTSFHAVVFSIIFNKKFFVIPHKKTGSRVNDLLKKLKITERAVNSLEEFEEKDFNEEINYKEVNNILEKERKKSIEWLNDAINS